jgi:hypothetical protein
VVEAAGFPCHDYGDGDAIARPATSLPHLDGNGLAKLYLELDRPVADHIVEP